MKLSVCCIMKNEELFADLFIKSALQFADEIIITVDTKSTDGTKEIVSQYTHGKVRMYELNFGRWFRKAKQFVNDKATGDWIFNMDADEVIHENNAKIIKQVIEEAEKQGLDALHVEYLHFIYCFKWIDNTEPLHIGIHRLYRKYPDVVYVRENHTLPECKNWRAVGFTNKILVWHLGYLRGMEKIRERFDRNYHYSEIHIPYHQVMWRDRHYFGDYPTKEIDPNCIPKVIRDHFMMEIGGSSILQIKR